MGGLLEFQCPRVLGNIDQLNDKRGWWGRGWWGRGWWGRGWWGRLGRRVPKLASDLID